MLGVSEDSNHQTNERSCREGYKKYTKTQGKESTYVTQQRTEGARVIVSVFESEVRLCVSGYIYTKSGKSVAERIGHGVSFEW